MQNLLFSLFFGLILFVCNISLTGQVNVNFPKKDKEELTKIRTSNIDLSGIWQIEISQKDWPGMPVFEDDDNGIATAKIEHIGNRITGRVSCNARFADKLGSLHYEKEFSGSFDGVTFFYKDKKVNGYRNNHKTMRRLETCLKTAELEFFIKDDHYYMEGSWSGYGHISGGPCSPGKILMKKLNPDVSEKEIQTFDVLFSKLTQKKKDIVIRKNKQTVKKLNGRKVSEGKQVTIRSNYITIEVYDHKKNDGDIISLNFNGDWILNEHEIEKEKHVVDVFINGDRDKNFLILYAHNLGNVPPNTAGIIIDDGHRKQRFTLNSDLKHSDILYFNVKEPKKK